jgi:ubiquinone/menaquinone biosynthesis C-methylase UbiE
MSAKHNKEVIREAVRKHYGEAIKTGGCCGPAPTQIDPAAAAKFVQLAGYNAADLADMPETATSFGCGNPVSFMEVEPGQTVLDLGSGAGMDLILASRKVGPTGQVIGLDMTPEMIDMCRRNLATAGVKNAEVRQGLMEQMPVADAEVDWIISNCVINLSPEKQKVFAEAFRVLKPGGRVMVSDIVTNDLPDEYRNDIMAWVGCLAGAEEEADYLQLIRDAGFEDVKIIDKLTYTQDTLSTLANDACGCGASERTVSNDLVAKFANRVASVKVSARKPG